MDHPRTGRRVPLGEFRFVAGLRRGAVAALARPVRAASHPRFSFGAPDVASVGADLALLALDAPIAPADATPFAVGVPDGRPLAIVSYRRGRAQVATLDARFLDLRRRRTEAFVERNARAIADLQARGLADPELDPSTAAMAPSSIAPKT